MEIIQKIDEKKIGYRGSKSADLLKNVAVKEQRVDGSLCFLNKHIRYTLMGFERSYQVKILSKQLNLNKQFSTFNTNSKLNAWFVTGLIDGEGSFIISIGKKRNVN
jgi:hypothetical protein